jgi:hypothetical protein
MTQPQNRQPPLMASSRELINLKPPRRGTSSTRAPAVLPGAREDRGGWESSWKIAAECEARSPGCGVPRAQRPKWCPPHLLPEAWPLSIDSDKTPLDNITAVSIPRGMCGQEPASHG